MSAHDWQSEDPCGHGGHALLVGRVADAQIPGDHDGIHLAPHPFQGLLGRAGVEPYLLLAGHGEFAVNLRIDLGQGGLQVLLADAYESHPASFAFHDGIGRQGG